ncbi:MAG: DUF4097 domain-containing protein [Chloroflexota bacterium]|nr:DUF4097 domain-containing protein [Chloroflexota bacterium]
MNATSNGQGLQFEVAADGAANLAVDGLSGDITIRGWDQPAIRISTTEDDYADSLEDVLNVQHQGNQVRINLLPTSDKWEGLLGGIGGKWAGLQNGLDLNMNDLRQGLADLGRSLGRLGRAGSVPLDIQVPHRCAVTVRTASGDIQVSAVQGNVFIQSAAGDVQLREIEGSVLVKGASSDVAIARLRGRLGLRTISGDLQVRETELAALSVGTVSGDLTLDAVLYPGADYDFQTVSGDLDLRLPADTKAAVEFETISGDFECRLPHQSNRQSRRHRQIAINGGGDLHLRIRTTSGDVQIGGNNAQAAGGPPPAWATAPADSEASMTRAFSPAESAAAQAAVVGDTFRVDSDPAPTQRLRAEAAPASPRPSAEMSILEAIERGELTVDEGLRRLAELAG